MILNITTFLFLHFCFFSFLSLKLFSLTENEGLIYKRMLYEFVSTENVENEVKVKVEFEF